MKVLELFSGTKSFTKECLKHGWECFTIDNNCKLNPDLCKDILDLTIQDIPFKPDIIWASPPCTCFSVASIGTHWTGGKKGYVPKSDNCKVALQIIEKTLDIIKEIDPQFYIIENPRGVMRKLSIVMYQHQEEVKQALRD